MGGVGLAAVAVSLASALTPEFARACSGPVPTFDEATAAAGLIVAGEVIASPHPWAYKVEVQEVFRGDVADTVLIGPREPPATPSRVRAARPRTWYASCS